jgi:putative membrane protein
VGEALLVSREGMLTRRTHVVPHARVQSLQLKQGPWQRRWGLADLQVDSPPGPVSVRARHRDQVEARGLLDRANALARAHR